MIENVKSGEAPQLPGETYAADLINFVARCLEKNPADRATVLELQGHPWIARMSSVPCDFVGWLRSFY